jgi:hypothetical protein
LRHPQTGVKPGEIAAEPAHLHRNQRAGQSFDLPPLLQGQGIPWISYLRHALVLDRLLPPALRPADAESSPGAIVAKRLSNWSIRCAHGDYIKQMNVIAH